MSKIYEGVCAGGPHHGKKIAAKILRILISIRQTSFGPGQGQATHSQGEYRFHLLLKMWIWQGKWKD
jgi:hypothetical protein